MSNPLLCMVALPPFSKIKPIHVAPAIDALLAEGRALVERCLRENEHYTWDNLIQPLAEMEDRISRVWSPIRHMNSVVSSEELREAYNTCLPKLTAYNTERGHHAGLYEAYKAIRQSEEYQQLNQAQKKIIENALRDFHLSGVDLPANKKVRFKEISQELSKLSTKFEENVLDASHGWDKLVTDENLLNGLPDSARASARQAAKQKQHQGWLFTLDFPSYIAVMTYADDRELRHEMYEAYVTRASDQGPNAGKWDNTEIMERMLALRCELAQLLGFKTYAHYSLAAKMAQDPEHVLGFLHDLAKRAKTVAKKERLELEAFAHERYGIKPLEAWDIAYHSEKLRQHEYAITQEELKPYLPETHVIPGMFAIVERLYDIKINERDGVDTWHKDVRFYEIQDQSGQLLGQFYLDLYARPKKRSSAWMDGCISRHRHANGDLQIPVAYLVCNLSPPIDNDPALFTHNEVLTLFHEFGHGLHHMLTRVDHIAVSGTNGVPWDAVELPSQFMENWCWERDALDMITGHYETGEPLPDHLHKKMYAAKNFQAGMLMVRQLEFALFDFRLHLEYDPKRGGCLQQILDEVRDEVAVVKPPAYNRFQHGFLHIFAGGYAAGYYSYKWAEVLSADAFSSFEEHGIFDRVTGQSFLENILTQGGSREPMELFVKFRGREPTIDALLRHNGIAA
jgi:oligopeptidase A